jgi:hypothetical protein
LWGFSATAASYCLRRLATITSSMPAGVREREILCFKTHHPQRSTTQRSGGYEQHLPARQLTLLVTVLLLEGHVLLVQLNRGLSGQRVDTKLVNDASPLVPETAGPTPTRKVGGPMLGAPDASSVHKWHRRACIRTLDSSARTCQTQGTGARPSRPAPTIATNTHGITTTHKQRLSRATSSR